MTPIVACIALLTMLVMVGMVPERFSLVVGVSELLLLLAAAKLLA